MIRDDELQSLLRSALPQVTGDAPSSDLWPRVIDRMQSRPEPHWMDIALAAGIAAALALVPQWFFVLAYHL